MSSQTIQLYPPSQEEQTAPDRLSRVTTRFLSMPALQRQGSIPAPLRVTESLKRSRTLRFYDYRDIGCVQRPFRSRADNPFYKPISKSTKAPFLGWGQSISVNGRKGPLGVRFMWNIQQTALQSTNMKIQRFTYTLYYIFIERSCLVLKLVHDIYSRHIYCTSNISS